MTRTILAMATAFFMAGAAHAQHAGHSGMAMPPTSGNASTQAFKDANATMHKDMDIALTGDADIDFARSMIPHHQGAIAMAKIVLAHGKNPEVRKLAEEVIRAQESEVAWMKEWLAKNATENAR